MNITMATGIYSPKKTTYEVIISHISKDVSSTGRSMYVMNCDIILAESKDETVIDRRTLYKTGKRKPSWLKYESHREVANKLAKAGTEVTYVTEQTLLDTVKNKEIALKADVYRSTQGNLIVSLLC